MFTQNYDLPTLFAQLGLPNDPAAIDAFIAAHSPLGDGLRIHQAPFWNAAQSRFLCEEVHKDAGWALVVDDLSERLRARPEGSGD